MRDNVTTIVLKEKKEKIVIGGPLLNFKYEII